MGESQGNGEEEAVDRIHVKQSGTLANIFNMNIFKEVKNLTAMQLVVYVFVFLAAVASGVLIIYHFKPQLFEKYDTLKVIVLSLAFTIPILMVNFAVSGIAICGIVIESKEPPDLYYIVLQAGILTSIIVYSGVLGSYLLSTSFRWFLTVVGSVEAIMLTAVILYQLYKRRGNRA